MIKQICEQYVQQELALFVRESQMDCPMIGEFETKIHAIHLACANPDFGLPISPNTTKAYADPDFGLPISPNTTKAYADPDFGLPIRMNLPNTTKELNILAEYVDYIHECVIFILINGDTYPIEYRVGCYEVHHLNKIFGLVIQFNIIVCEHPKVIQRDLKRILANLETVV